MDDSLPSAESAQLSRTRTRRSALLLFLGLLVLYHVNGRPKTSVDTLGPTYTAWTLVRHGSLDLGPYPNLDYLHGPHIIQARDGSWVSIRSLGSALAAVPFFVPAALFCKDVPRPTNMEHLAKLAAASWVAGAAVVFFLLCRRLAPSAAWPATLLFAVGTNMWTVSSQALWTHGPATFWVCAALYLLLTRAQDAAGAAEAEGVDGPGFWRAVGAGLALGMAVLCRPTTALFGAATGAALLGRKRLSALAGLAVGSIAPLAVYFAVNACLFDDVVHGGYLHDNWKTHPSLSLSLPGLLIAPSRGLLVYTPALLLMPLAVFALRGRRWPATLLAAWSVAAALTLVLYARWHDWAGGWCYGPRFLCELLPLCCLLFALALELFPRGVSWRSTAVRQLAKGLVALSIAIHAAGIFGDRESEDWFVRHTRFDSNRCLFELHDTQIEVAMRGTLWAVERRWHSLSQALHGTSE